MLPVRLKRPRGIFDEEPSDEERKWQDRWGKARGQARRGYEPNIQSEMYLIGAISSTSPRREAMVQDLLDLGGKRLAYAVNEIVSDLSAVARRSRVEPQCLFESLCVLELILARMIPWRAKAPLDQRDIDSLNTTVMKFLRVVFLTSDQDLRTDKIWPDVFRHLGAVSYTLRDRLLSKSMWAKLASTLLIWYTAVALQLQGTQQDLLEALNPTKLFDDETLLLCEPLLGVDGFRICYDLKSFPRQKWLAQRMQRCLNSFSDIETPWRYLVNAALPIDIEHTVHWFRTRAGKCKGKPEYIFYTRLLENVLVKSPQDLPSIAAFVCYSNHTSREKSAASQYVPRDEILQVVLRLAHGEPILFARVVRAAVWYWFAYSTTGKLVEESQFSDVEPGAIALVNSTPDVDFATVLQSNWMDWVQIFPESYRERAIENLRSSVFDANRYGIPIHNRIQLKNIELAKRKFSDTASSDDDATYGFIEHTPKPSRVARHSFLDSQGSGDSEKFWPKHGAGSQEVSKRVGEAIEPLEKRSLEQRRLTNTAEIPVEGPSSWNKDQPVTSEEEVGRLVPGSKTGRKRKHVDGPDAENSPLNSFDLFTFSLRDSRILESVERTIHDLVAREKSVNICRERFRKMSMLVLNVARDSELLTFESQAMIIVSTWIRQGFASRWRPLRQILDNYFTHFQGESLLLQMINDLTCKCSSDGDLGYVPVIKTAIEQFPGHFQTSPALWCSICNHFLPRYIEELVWDINLGRLRGPQYSSKKELQFVIENLLHDSVLHSHWELFFAEAAHSLADRVQELLLNCIGLFADGAKTLGWNRLREMFSSLRSLLRSRADCLFMLLDQLEKPSAGFPDELTLWACGVLAHWREHGPSDAQLRIRQVIERRTS